MIQFKATIQKFEKKGEKTGWTYVVLPEKLAQELQAGNRKSFRVKGRLDAHSIKSVALIPMGDGSFIMPLNAAMRKAIGKGKGAELQLWLEVDKEEPALSKDLLQCLRDEPQALQFFQSLAKGHQRYFSKWIEDAKTPQTQAKRIAQAVDALSRSWGFPEMLKAQKAAKENEPIRLRRP